MQLTRNFHLKEFTRSNTATRLGISNEPTEEHVQNLKTLCEKVLQPLRDAIGPIRITSGYRSAELNAAIGGASRNGKPTSEHCFGMAADLQFTQRDEDGKVIENNAKLFNAILALGLEFNQIIWEFGTDEQPDWVHVSHNPNGNKGQKLRASKENKRTVYSTI